MKLKLFILCLIPILTLYGFQADEDPDYIKYHKLITEAEQLISEEEFGDGLIIYEQIFQIYDFVFLRDYKVASQLALYINDKEKAFDYIKKGIAGGWGIKDLKKNQFLKILQKDPEWKIIEQSYNDIRSQYESRIDSELRDKVHLMFKKDQKKALGALFRFGEKAQERYGTKKFAPHSENQMFDLIDILNTDGYPGEKLIGNDFWMSTILSHHNSISPKYAKKDTLYDFIRPKLFSAIENGEMSPYEYALIDDWQKAVESERTVPGYGFLISPKDYTLLESNKLRQNIGLRSIALRNKLVDIERKTGMSLYLPNWIKGKIKLNK